MTHRKGSYLVLYPAKARIPNTDTLSHSLLLFFLFHLLPFHFISFHFISLLFSSLLIPTQPLHSLSQPSLHSLTTS